MRINQAPVCDRVTHEGAPASQIGPEELLRRTLMACLLWEDTFYEDGLTIAQRIATLVPHIATPRLIALCDEAKNTMRLRHAPLLVAAEMARHPTHRRALGALLPRIINRADEPAEFLALYWAAGRCPIAKQVKTGLARALQKFSAYQLAKYNRPDAIKIRDVLFMVHAKPKDAEQAATWKQLIAGTLPAPDTWEVALSSGADKRETWERLLGEKKLGTLALLRNLRNMLEVGVSDELIRRSIREIDPRGVLPYRFIAAARYAPRFEPDLEAAMFSALADAHKLSGHTVLLVDVSSSMTDPLSSKSDLRRIDAACALAMLLRETAERVSVFAFNQEIREVPPRRGFALRDAIGRAGGGTYLGAAVAWINQNIECSRLIVVSDEQTADRVPNPTAPGYMLNVGSYQNGVGYTGGWIHITGWSEAVLDFIRAHEDDPRR